MKRWVWSVLLLVLVLAGCTEQPMQWPVRFDTGDDASFVVDVALEDPSSLPDDPVRAGYLFDGWYWDDGVYEEPFSLGSLLDASLTGDLTVYAKWSPITSSLSTTLENIYHLYADTEAFAGETYDEWLESVRGPQGIPGIDGKNVFLRVAEGFVQWQHEGDSSWQNLIDLPALSGADGKQLHLQVSDGYIQWQHEGDEAWTNLVELSLLTGEAGLNGVDGLDGLNGSDGREVMMRVSNGYIQWKYQEETTWTDLLSLAAISATVAADFQTDVQVAMVAYASFLSRFDGLILGDSMVTGLEGWHTVYEYEQYAEIPRDSLTGLPTGSRIYYPVVLIMPVSRATPFLWKQFSQGITQDITIQFYQTNDLGHPVNHYTVDLVDAIFLSIEHVKNDTYGTELGWLDEYIRVELSFSSITWEYPIDGVQYSDNWMPSR